MLERNDSVMGAYRTIIYWTLILLAQVSPLTVATLLAEPDSEKGGHHVITLEAFGKAGFYSFNYDQRAQGGDAAWGVSSSYQRWISSNARLVETQTMIGPYANFYFSWLGQSFYVTHGYMVVIGKTRFRGRDIYSFGAFASLGLGYEYRVSNGLTVRVCPYLLLNNQPIPTGGFGVGYAL